MTDLERRFKKQRARAGQRGIPFLLTFEEWLCIWQESGHLHERGRRGVEYVMARHGDTGPYAVGNVKIITAAENLAETRKPLRQSFREEIKLYYRK